jgi:uncharacterized membrane protein YphA (DoxX/SURF4 family)
MKTKRIFHLILKVIVAIILLQTLYFKFTGAEESKYIFESVGMEPWGRIGSGVVELLAVILLFIPPLTWLGALLALGSMAGAIFFHLTSLGIEVKDDGGLLFFLACTVLICCLIILWLERHKISLLNKIPTR